ncbi:MAG: IclR family transcriptional regulator [Naasia sp.]
MSATTGVKSADRALALVEFVAARGDVSFNDVLDGLGLPRSSAHGLLRTLVESGWLTHSPASKRFGLGLRAWQIGQQYEGHRDLVDVSRTVMDRLCDEVGETVQLARLDGVENVYIAISTSPNPMRLASSVGMRLPAYATGIGKALLSTLPPEEAARRLAQTDRPALTERTVTDLGRLGELLDQTRERGYALDDEEYIEGCRCVAVPITRDSDAGFASAMSITMPTGRTGAGWPGDLVTTLTAAAAEIRSALGVPA